jgi:hypothetical protein
MFIYASTKEISMENELELEVFKAGDYGPKGTWDEAALDRIAEDYDPRLHEAPVTLDHAQTGPALGWVAGLRRVGDRLVARLRGLSERLMGLIRAGAFKKRSVEIYPRLRESGGPYLRAVSFLGAAAPEVKGLADPDLGAPMDRAGVPDLDDAFGQALFGEEEDEGGHVALEMEGTEGAQGNQGTQEAQRQEGAQEMQEPAVTEMAEAGTTGVDGDTAEADSADSESSEGALADMAGADMSAFEELRARLMAAGRWLPTWDDRGIDDFWRALASVDDVPAGPDATISPAEWFGRFLEELPTLVTMSEAAPARRLGWDAASEPRGGNVDPDSLAIHRRVVRFMEAHPGTDYASAMARCAG